MRRIRAACGCWLSEEEGHGINVSIKEYSKEGYKAVAYMNCCKKCYKKYKKRGIILKSEEEEIKWMKNEAT